MSYNLSYSFSNDKSNQSIESLYYTIQRNITPLQDNQPTDNIQLFIQKNQQIFEELINQCDIEIKFHRNEQKIVIKNIEFFNNKIESISNSFKKENPKIELIDKKLKKIVLQKFLEYSFPILEWKKNIRDLKESIELLEARDAPEELAELRERALTSSRLFMEKVSQDLESSDVQSLKARQLILMNTSVYDRMENVDDLTLEDTQRRFYSIKTEFVQILKDISELKGSQANNNQVYAEAVKTWLNHEKSFFSVLLDVPTVRSSSEQEYEEFIFVQKYQDKIGELYLLITELTTSFLKHSPNAKDLKNFTELRDLIAIAEAKIDFLVDYLNYDREIGFIEDELVESGNPSEFSCTAYLNLIQKLSDFEEVISQHKNRNLLRDEEIDRKVNSRIHYSDQVAQDFLNELMDAMRAELKECQDQKNLGSLERLKENCLDWFSLGQEGLLPKSMMKEIGLIRNEIDAALLKGKKKNWPLKLAKNISIYLKDNEEAKIVLFKYINENVIDSEIKNLLIEKSDFLINIFNRKSLDNVKKEALIDGIYFWLQKHHPNDHQQLIDHIRSDSFSEKLGKIIRMNEIISKIELANYIFFALEAAFNNDRLQEHKWSVEPSHLRLPSRSTIRNTLFSFIQDDVFQGASRASWRGTDFGVERRLVDINREASLSINESYLGDLRHLGGQEFFLNTPEGDRIHCMHFDAADFQEKFEIAVRGLVKVTGENTRMYGKPDELNNELFAFIQCGILKDSPDSEALEMYLPMSQSKAEIENKMPTTAIICGGSGVWFGIYKSMIARLLLNGLNVMTFSYRGYEHSSGIPSDIAIHQDLELVGHYLRNEKGVPDQNQMLYASCLGLGVAAKYAASHENVDVFVDRSFAKLSTWTEEMISKGHMPIKFVPNLLAAKVARIALPHIVDFESVDYLKKASGEIVIVMAEDDELVLQEEQKRLKEALPNSKYLIIKGFGHTGNWLRNESYIKNFETYLLESGKSRSYQC